MSVLAEEDIFDDDPVDFATMFAHLWGGRGRGLGAAATAARAYAAPDVRAVRHYKIGIVR